MDNTWKHQWRYKKSYIISLIRTQIWLIKEIRKGRNTTKSNFFAYCTLNLLVGTNQSTMIFYTEWFLAKVL